MGSINHLNSKEAIEKVKELAEDIKVCMFCTRLTEQPFETRPMAVQEVDDEGNLWFLSSVDSNKNIELKEDDEVQLIFSKSGDSHFMSIFGTAKVFSDQQKIEEIWNPVAKAWFTEGKDDPSISAIRVSPLSAYYWDTKDGKMISLIKIAAAMVTGRTMDGGVEGQLNL